jgi:hypothetical protein
MVENNAMQAFSEKLKANLKSEKCTIDDIEQMMGDTIKQFRNDLLTQAGEIISNSMETDGLEGCPKCRRSLKKTKREGSR